MKRKRTRSGASKPAGPSGPQAAATRRTRRSDTPRSKVGRWSDDEIRAVAELYLELDGQRLHEGNPEIIALGQSLQRQTRAVESQLLMFRALDRGGDYSRHNMSALCRDAWNEIEPKLTARRARTEHAAAV